MSLEWKKLAFTSKLSKLYSKKIDSQTIEHEANLMEINDTSSEKAAQLFMAKSYLRRSLNVDDIKWDGFIAIADGLVQMILTEKAMEDAGNEGFWCGSEFLTQIFNIYADGIEKSQYVEISDETRNQIKL